MFKLLAIILFSFGSFMGFKYGFWQPIVRSISAFTIESQTPKFAIDLANSALHKWNKRLSVVILFILLFAIIALAVTFVQQVSDLDTYIENSITNTFNSIGHSLNTSLNFVISKMGKFAYPIILAVVLVGSFLAFYSVFASIALSIMLIFELIKMEDLFIYSILWLMGKLYIVPDVIPIQNIWKHYLNRNNPYKLVLMLLNRFFPSLSLGGGRFNGGGAGGKW